MKRSRPICSSQTPPSNKWPPKSRSCAPRKCSTILRTLPKDLSQQAAALKHDFEPTSHANLSARLASQDKLLQNLAAMISGLSLSASPHVFDAPGPPGAAHAAHTYGELYTSSERLSRSPRPASSLSTTGIPHSTATCACSIRAPPCPHKPPPPPRSWNSCAPSPTAATRHPS